MALWPATLTPVFKTEPGKFSAIISSNRERAASRKSLRTWNKRSYSPASPIKPLTAREKYRSARAPPAADNKEATMILAKNQINRSLRKPSRPILNIILSPMVTIIT